MNDGGESAAPGTPLDAAFRAQAADPDPALRLRFHERILDAELAVPLAAPIDAAGGSLRPEVFDLEDGRVVLAFDRDERLADFFGAPVDFAALTGRRLVALLAGQGTGIALNLGAPSATLLPGAAVDWLAAMVPPAPEARETRLAALAAPDLPPALRDALAAKLAAMADALAAAYLVAANADAAGEAAGGAGGAGLVLVLTGVAEASRAGVAAAVAEAVRFTADAPPVDLAFVEAESPASAAVARAGLRLDLGPDRHGPAAQPAPRPGMDPAKPPRLR